jgi:hypothetical protein
MAKLTAWPIQIVFALKVVFALPAFSRTPQIGEGRGTLGTETEKLAGFGRLRFAIVAKGRLPLLQFEPKKRKAKYIFPPTARKVRGFLIGRLLLRLRRVGDGPAVLPAAGSQNWSFPSSREANPDCSSV